MNEKKHSTGLFVVGFFPFDNALRLIHVATSITTFSCLNAQ